jgi:hypothetical protein
MMPKYRVTIETGTTGHINVEADNSLEARNIALQVNRIGRDDYVNSEVTNVEEIEDNYDPTEDDDA